MCRFALNGAQEPAFWSIERWSSTSLGMQIESVGESRRVPAAFTEVNF